MLFKPLRRHRKQDTPPVAPQACRHSKDLVEDRHWGPGFERPSPSTHGTRDWHRGVQLLDHALESLGRRRVQKVKSDRRESRLRLYVDNMSAIALGAYANPV